MKKISIILLSVSLVMTACSSENETDVEKTSLPAVTVEKASFQTYQPVEVSGGSLFAKKEANLASILPGRVEKFYVKEGEQVKKGQLIAELSGELLTTAQIEYETYKKDFGRVKRLYEKGSMSEQKYDHVKAQYEAKEAQYKLVKKNTEIRAPFAGTITKKMIQEGETFLLMNPGLDVSYSHASGVVRLMDLEELEAEIAVNEKDIHKYSIGMSAEVAVDAFPEEKWNGKITKIGHTFETMSKTTTVTVAIQNPDKKLKPGMYCKVAIPMAERKDIFIPLLAVERQAATGFDFVYVIQKDTAKRKKITRIYSSGDQVAISGISAGEMVVVDGRSKIRDGVKVKVANK